MVHLNVSKEHYQTRNLFMKSTSAFFPGFSFKQGKIELVANAYTVPAPDCIFSQRQVSRALPQIMAIFMQLDQSILRFACAFCGDGQISNAMHVAFQLVHLIVGTITFGLSRGCCVGVYSLWFYENCAQKRFFFQLFQIE